MDALFIAELNERLFTHFTQGAWRAPFSQRLRAAGRTGTAPLGQIACADPRDLARALAALDARPGPPPDPATLRALLDADARTLAEIRRREGFADALPRAALGPAPGPDGPSALLSAAALPLSQLVPLLIAGARYAMIWKPAPGAAASAHLLMRRLGPLAAGRLAMVQGDHTTGAALVGMLPPGTRLIWASPADPPADLPAGMLRPAAIDPARP